MSDIKRKNKNKTKQSPTITNEREQKAAGDERIGGIQSERIERGKKRARGKTRKKKEKGCV